MFKLVKKTHSKKILTLNSFFKKLFTIFSKAYSTLTFLSRT